MRLTGLFFPFVVRLACVSACSCGKTCGSQVKRTAQRRLIAGFRSMSRQNASGLTAWKYWSWRGEAYILTPLPRWLPASIAVSRVSTDQRYYKVTIRAPNDRKLGDTGTDDGGKTSFRRDICVGKRHPPASCKILEDYSSPTLRTARKASCGMSTLPIRFMRFLPSFCFSRSLRLRLMSPP